MVNYKKLEDDSKLILLNMWGIQHKMIQFSTLIREESQIRYKGSQEQTDD